MDPEEAVTVAGAPPMNSPSPHVTAAYTGSTGRMH
jgi:hypothetical protein